LGKGVLILNHINEETIVKELNEFPQFTIDVGQKEKMLREVISGRGNLSKSRSLFSVAKYVAALAATILLSFAMITGWVGNQNAAKLNTEKKIINDVGISLEKLRIITIPYLYENSKLKTDEQVKKLLGNYYQNPALAEIFLTWQEARMDDGTISEQEIENSKLKIIFGDNPQSSETSIEKTGRDKVTVTRMEKKTGSIFTLECNLEGNRWMISEIKM
jgi:hypothetical protein